MGGESITQSRSTRGSGAVIKLGEVVMLLDLHRQGLTVSAIARELGVDRKTVRRCIARGLETPVWLIDPFVPYLRERALAYPGLTGRRLWRELRERGYEGGYTAVTDVLRDIRPAPLPAFEVRFETPPGDQAQVDFAQFQLQFTDEPTITRIVWLFSFVLGFSRLIWARFVLHQDMQTVLRCHMAAFEAIGGIPHEILYDRMKTAVIGEAGGSIVYNRALIDFARHYGFQPKACRPYRAKTKGKVERPLPLHPRGLLPRPLVPQSRRSQCPIAALARHGCQSSRARHHAARGQRGLR